MPPNPPLQPPRPAWRFRVSWPSRVRPVTRRSQPVLAGAGPARYFDRGPCGACRATAAPDPESTRSRPHTMSASENTPAKDPHLPTMGRLGELLCPRAPQTIAEARLEDGALTDLAVKFAYTINRFTDDWLGERLRVAPALAGALVTQLLSEGAIEET